MGVKTYASVNWSDRRPHLLTSLAHPLWSFLQSEGLICPTGASASPGLCPLLGDALQGSVSLIHSTSTHSNASPFDCSCRNALSFVRPFPSALFPRAIPAPVPMALTSSLRGSTTMLSIPASRCSFAVDSLGRHTSLSRFFDSIIVPIFRLIFDPG
jgi:hypothetical protein